MPDFKNPVQVKNSRALVSDGYSAVVGSHTQNSDLDEVVSISVPATAGIWFVQCQTQNVRFTLDGTAPTTGKGFLIKAGDPPISISVEPGSTIKVIEVSASAVLEYQFLT
mgnify:CR=1 FL=1